MQLFLESLKELTTTFGRLIFLSIFRQHFKVGSYFNFKQWLIKILCLLPYYLSYLFTYFCTFPTCLCKATGQLAQLWGHRELNYCTAYLSASHCCPKTAKHTPLTPTTFVAVAHYWLVFSHQHFLPLTTHWEAALILQWSMSAGNKQVTEDKKQDTYQLFGKS